MKRFTEQIKKQSSKITLSARERDDLRDRLVAYMEYHPLTQKSSVSSLANELKSQPFISIPINWFYVRGTAVAMAVFMVITVPVAAEYTKPGDVLYPVKVRFNEEVRSTMTFDQYEKIEWETERLERRVAEARLLVAEGKLTPDMEIEVAEAVKKHSHKAKEKIAELREDSEDDAAIAEIAFASALEVQVEVLDKALSTQQTDKDKEEGVENVSTGQVLASVMAEASEAAIVSQSSTPSIEKLLAKIESDTTTAEELFASIKENNRANTQEMADIERRLSDIGRKVEAVLSEKEEVVVPAEEIEIVPAAEEEATTTDEFATITEEKVEQLFTATTDTDEDVKAKKIESLRDTLSDLRKLISFMTDLDIRASVTVDELVPISLTDEEKIDLVQVAMTELTDFVNKYEAIEMVGDGSEKVEDGIKSVSLSIEKANSAIANKDVTGAEEAVVEGRALMNDLKQIIEKMEIEVPPVAESMEEEVATSTVVEEGVSTTTEEENQ